MFKVFTPCPSASVVNFEHVIASWNSNQVNHSAQHIQYTSLLFVLLHVHVFYFEHVFYLLSYWTTVKYMRKKIFVWS